MEQVTKTNGMVIKSYGVNEYGHEIGVKRIVNNTYYSLHDSFYITEPDRDMVENWIEQGEDNAEFLSDALKNNATIYTLWEVIIGDYAQPIGDFAVYYDE